MLKIFKLRTDKSISTLYMYLMSYIHKQTDKSYNNTRCEQNISTTY